MDFNPRAPCGARLHGGADGQRQHEHFNPRAPCGARPRGFSLRSGAHRISIHAPRAGRDEAGDVEIGSPTNFNPRAPCGARLAEWKRMGYSVKFQSTRPVRGATGHFLPFLLPVLISIHAPRAGRDDEPFAVVMPIKISIHAPRAGRDSKSIKNYFTHFCDNRQFLDNFTQNAAF